MLSACGLARICVGLRTGVVFVVLVYYILMPWRRAVQNAAAAAASSSPQTITTLALHAYLAAHVARPASGEMVVVLAEHRRLPFDFHVPAAVPLLHNEASRSVICQERKDSKCNELAIDDRIAV